MDTYLRMRRAVIATVCACSAVAGVGMAAAPGSALAVEVECGTTLNGTGSSLQGAQQTLWKTESELGKLKDLEAGSVCKAILKVTYAANGSGAGLGEFGMEAGFKLEPALGVGAKLDGFIGTDDPPTTEQIKETEKVAAEHAGTRPVTIAPMEAPIAMIMHLPEGCTLAVGSKEPEVKQADLELMWLHDSTMTWKKLLETDGKAKLTDTAKNCESATVSSAALAEGRFDNSGTSYAFKQWMCQVSGASATWNPAANGCEQESIAAGHILNDSKEWPAAVKIQLTHTAGNNEKGSGEAAAVCEEKNSFGYANAADAVAAACAFGPGAAGNSTFWVKVENKEVGVFEDPLSGTKGNCPEAYKLKNKVAAEKGEWSQEHLAVGGAGKSVDHYPVCTLTFDVGWTEYGTAELSAAKYYETKAKAETIGLATHAYFLWELGKAAGEGQATIATDYAPASAEVLAASLVDLGTMVQ
jgi:hypothetical protein